MKNSTVKIVSELENILGMKPGEKFLVYSREPEEKARRAAIQRDMLFHLYIRKDNMYHWYGVISNRDTRTLFEWLLGEWDVETLTIGFLEPFPDVQKLEDLL